MARQKATSKGQRASTRVANKATGKKKPHNYNKDRKPKTTSDDKIVAEAEAQLRKVKGETLTEEVETLPIEATKNSNTGLSNNVTRAAMAAGLSEKKILAATVLASGNSIAMAASEAGVATSTVQLWKKQIPFRAFLNELTIGLMDEAKGDAIRHIFQQLRNDPDKRYTEKDIFDWVKLALTVGGNRGGGRDDGAASASILHQHVHLHGEGGAVATKDSDSALLINLNNATREIKGPDRRRISEILRAAES